MIKIGNKIPKMTLDSSGGQVIFPLEENWSVLYYYPGDYQPTSETDILALDMALSKFKAYNTSVYGVSPDSVPTHISWLMTLSERKNGKSVGVELVSDYDGIFSEVFSLRGTDSDMNFNEKAIIILDQDGIVRSFSRHSYNTGINVTEIERELLSLKAAFGNFGQTPAGWTPGAQIIEHPPRTYKTAKNNVYERTAQGMRCVDWYICYRSDNL